jgi:sensor c-di-GMP phosphodiesterase-like protein
MLLGIPEVTFTATVDGRPLDPATGRPADRPVPLPIRVNQTRRLPLRGLAPGRHVLAVSYRPDTDAPTLVTTVPVTVTAGQSRLTRLAVPAGLVVVLVAAAAVVWRRRDRAARHAELPR